MVFYVQNGGAFMNIVELVRKKLQEEYNSGITQAELGKKYHIKQSHVSRILGGSRTVSFEVFETMFPKATINLGGDEVSITANQNSGNVVGINNGTISGDCLSAVVDKILSSDLSDAEKVKFIQVVKK